VRPGAVAATAAVGALRDPHLLEGRPAVRETLAQEEARRVRPHEAAVHLQATPVRVAGVAPAALEVVDAEPAALVRRMRREPADVAHLATPVAQGARSTQRGNRVCVAHPDDGLPAPGRAAQAPYERGVDVSPRLGRLRLDVARVLGSRGERETPRCRERRACGRADQHGGEHRQERTFWFHRRTPPLESDWSRLYWGASAGGAAAHAQWPGRFDLVPTAFDA